MAIAAAAMTAVAAQPSTTCHGEAVKSPMILRRLAMIIIATMMGTTMTPFSTALQISALIGSSADEVDGDAEHDGQRDHEVERPRPAQRLLEPDAPAARLADGIGRRACQHRHGQQAGADEAQAEQEERRIASDRLQRLGRLLGGLDVGLARRMQRHGRGQDDEEGDEVGDPHADPGVPADAIEFALRLLGASNQRTGLVIGSLVFDLLRALPEEEVGADGGAEYRDDQGERSRRRARTSAAARPASPRASRSSP